MFKVCIVCMFPLSNYLPSYMLCCDCTHRHIRYTCEHKNSAMATCRNGKIIICVLNYFEHFIKLYKGPETGLCLQDLLIDCVFLNR